MRGEKERRKKKESDKEERDRSREEKRKKKERGERKNKKKEFFIIAFEIVPFQIWNSNVHSGQIIWHLEISTPHVRGFLVYQMSNIWHT